MHDTFLFETHPGHTLCVQLFKDVSNAKCACSEIFIAQVMIC